MQQNHTVAAISTPPGQGGIAVIRISGQEAIEVGDRVFRPKNREKSLKSQPGYTALFGDFLFRKEAVDEGIALVFKNPHSYTGEDVVELNCHGGEVISRQVLLSCFEAGAAPAEPGEFTKRAVVNGRMDLSQAEAVMDMISATSRQGAALAKSNLDGALQKRIQEQKDKLIALSAHLTALIDFPEEDVEDLTIQEYLKTVVEVKQNLQALGDDYEKGMVLRRGIRAVIAGSPNVGKSTLFNLLAGFDRSIVTSVAGTTRDTITEEIIVGGIPLRIADTAGIHDTENEIESEGIRRSLEEMEKAGLVVAVFDGSKALEETDRKIMQQAKDKISLAIINKSDLEMQIEQREIQKIFKESITISAKSPDSREQIENAVRKILEIEEISPDMGTLSNQRQLHAVMTAVQALQMAQDAINNDITYDAVSLCVDDALLYLAEITGENVSEEVLNQVFDNFCVGK